MGPLDVAGEVKVEADAGVIIRLSTRLVVALAILVLLGIGVLTVNVFLLKEQVEHITNDLSDLATVLGASQARVSTLEREGSIAVNQRLQRLERDVERCLDK